MLQFCGVLGLRNDISRERQTSPSYEKLEALSPGNDEAGDRSASRQASRSSNDLVSIRCPSQRGTTPEKPGDPMQERSSALASSTQFTNNLIMVMEQDEEIGTKFVQMIRQETPYQAILATSLQHARTILHHLHCDVFLLINDTFPDEDLERLYLLPADVEPPALLNLTFLSGTYHYQEDRDVKSLVKAVKLLLSACDAPLSVLSPLGSEQAIVQTG